MTFYYISIGQQCYRWFIYVWTSYTSSHLLNSFFETQGENRVCVHHIYQHVHKLTLGF